MDFKYQAQLNSIPDCPPNSLKPCGGTLAIRFVHDPVKASDFHPVSKKSPRRQLDEDTMCAGWALSFFTTRTLAEKRYAELRRTCKQIQKTIGTHTAEVRLTPSDGHVNSASSNGHFSLYEAANVSWTGRAKNLKLVP